LRPTGDGTFGGRGVDPVAPSATSEPARTVDPVHTGTGAQTIDLGPRPDGMHAVTTSVACFTPGRIRWPDGSALYCYDDDVSSPDEPRTIGWYDMALAPGQDTLRIRATPGMRWQMTTGYVREAR
ncbi:hypothetical protein ACFP8W_20025, partial [Nocardioides hankookensis]